jgi:hypothetical protein
MKIRSITCSAIPIPLAGVLDAQARSCDARSRLQAAGYQVQTTRLATIPFPRLLGEKNLYALPALARELDLLIKQIEVGYACLGPAVPVMPPSYEVIPEAVAATQNVFFGGIMAERRTGIDPHALHACAQIIAKCAALIHAASPICASPPGQRARRFAFFCAYHRGVEPAFAIATGGQLTWQSTPLLRRPLSAQRHS